ncbi:TetR family transcriptional regulator [Nocardia tenerifensis]|uniref:TetR family transcriptional regulator n=1 Tax=Nocardia tenerifensis TaxID=228006 RepID=A0A318JUV1_9NOCA|nr:helix-turn-helix domain-containing protein [Nocardia tenerifensis]PXX60874.1 TetR family transcriptional regulator [Nocardia tenerifensis]
MATTSARLSKQDRCEQLLDTASAIVRARGADALTLVTLAEAAGVSRPIVYDHFDTRPGLLLALYRRRDERHPAASTETVSAAEPAVTEIARVLSTGMAEHPQTRRDRASTGSGWPAAAGRR